MSLHPTSKRLFIEDVYYWNQTRKAGVTNSSKVYISSVRQIMAEFLVGFLQTISIYDVRRAFDDVLQVYVCITGLFIGNQSLPIHGVSGF